MGLKPTFTEAELKAYINSRFINLDKAVLSAYQQVGEQFVRDARLNGPYNDITGNLRSSIGFLIYKDGIPQLEAFSESDKGTDRVTGMTTASEYAREVAEQYSNGWVLVCVAGMHYAAAVESKGKDVITGSSITAQTHLKQLIAQLRENVKR